MTFPRVRPIMKMTLKTENVGFGFQTPVENIFSQRENCQVKSKRLLLVETLKWNFSSITIVVSPNIFAQKIKIHHRIIWTYEIMIVPHLQQHPVLSNSSHVSTLKMLHRSNKKQLQNALFVLSWTQSYSQ